MAKGQTILYFFVWFMLLSAPHEVLMHLNFIVKQRDERDIYIVCSCSG